MVRRSFELTSPHVLEQNGDLVVVARDDIASVINAAKAAPNGRARLLLHPNAEDHLHEMVIALPPTSCDHPHINYKSGKSFVALSGRFAVMCFSHDGSVTETFVLSAGSWAGDLMVRLRASTWHTIIPLQGDTVFLETIIGPFTGNYFAEWFPSQAGSQQHIAYIDRLRRIAQTQAERLDHESL